MALQTVRPDIPVDYADGRSSFRETIGPLYLELTDLLLQEAAGRNGQPQTAPLLLEARTTMEALKTAEVRDYFRDPCLAPLQAHGTGASGTPGRTATLYPIILGDRLELLLAFTDGRQLQVITRIDEASLGAMVRQLRRELETVGTREFLPSSQRLYDLVLRPLEPELAARQVETLIVVPDGVLRSIPFGALHDGRHFLTERYAVATELGLTLFDPKPIARQQLRALLSGLSKSVQDYPPLPFVTDEIRSLSHIARDNTVLTDNSSAACASSRRCRGCLIRSSTSPRTANSAAIPTGPSS
ncbi:CHAT domain-containing protein [Rhodovastum atsumiense]|uniref:CHAT domain-containing protein n=1 Tax=Rhodovastum atsumiense TaxID=504468 RepID=A0A5M6IXS1_9PROT|nr:CHAT domain-containing protein [Rhodovastum atsumiense]KAA5613082.1 CHAT domain-containing protein [Rhodovastum atsumiense]CAH2600051.1 CHAT domain-containing protein [Rhodovastum atsumiense]